MPTASLVRNFAATVHDYAGSGWYNAAHPDLGIALDGVTDDGPAWEALDSSWAVLVPSGVSYFADDTTVSLRALKFSPGATWKVASGKTVTIEVTDDLDIPLSAQAFDISLGGAVEVRRSVVSANWWGAVADATTDCTDAISAARDSIRSTASGGRGTILLPDLGEYRGSADLSSATATFDREIVLQGMGKRVTTLSAYTADGIVVDLLGTNGACVRDITIGSSAVESQCGVLLARSATSANCNGNQFSNVLIGGNFRLASVVAIAAESTTWEGCEFENSNEDAAYCLLWTGTSNAIGVDTPNGTPQTSSNTDNRMTACEFYAPSNGAQQVIFHTGAGYRFIGCTSIGGGTANRLFTFIETGSFEGPVEFHGHHWECYGDAESVALYLECPGVSAQFRNINVFGGCFMSDSGRFIDFDRTDRTNQPVLFESTVTTVKGNSGQPDLTLYLFAIQNSDITWLEQEANGTVVALGYVADSTIKAMEYRGPCAAVNFQYQHSASAIPTSGTFQRGQLVMDCEPTAGSAIGWVCTTAGTLGTLNSGNTTGTISSPTNVLSVNSATGISPGMLINVVGASGPFIVWHVDGTTVTLGTTSTTVSGAAVSYSTPTLSPLATAGPSVRPRYTLTYVAGSMQLNCGLYNDFTVTPTDGGAFSFTHALATAGQQITLTIINSVGGALGAATFTGFKLASWTQPADGYSRSITFEYDGSTMREVSRTTADVPN